MEYNVHQIFISGNVTPRVWGLFFTRELPWDWSDYAVVKFLVRQYPVLLWDTDAEITSYSSDQINCDESGQPE